MYFRILESNVSLFPTLSLHYLNPFTLSSVQCVVPGLITLLQATFTFPQSVGIAGGKPSSSYYFVGMDSSNDTLLFLDPHQVRPAVPFRPGPSPPSSLADRTQSSYSRQSQTTEDGWLCTAYTPAQLDTYHGSKMHRLPLRMMDPSMLLGFVVRSRAEWDDLVARLGALKKPILSVNVAPAPPRASLPATAPGTAVGWDPSAEWVGDDGVESLTDSSESREEDEDGDQVVEDKFEKQDQDEIEQSHPLTSRPQREDVPDQRREGREEQEQKQEQERGQEQSEGLQSFQPRHWDKARDERRDHSKNQNEGHDDHHIDSAERSATVADTRQDTSSQEPRQGDIGPDCVTEADEVRPETIPLPTDFDDLDLETNFRTELDMKPTIPAASTAPPGSKPLDMATDTRLAHPADPHSVKVPHSTLPALSSASKRPSGRSHPGKIEGALPFPRKVTSPPEESDPYASSSSHSPSPSYLNHRQGPRSAPKVSTMGSPEGAVLPTDSPDLIGDSTDHDMPSLRPPGSAIGRPAAAATAAAAAAAAGVKGSHRPRKDPPSFVGLGNDDRAMADELDGSLKFSGSVPLSPRTSGVASRTGLGSPPASPAEAVHLDTPTRQRKQAQSFGPSPRSKKVNDNPQVPPLLTPSPALFYSSPIPSENVDRDDDDEVVPPAVSPVQLEKRDQEKRRKQNLQMEMEMARAKETGGETIEIKGRESEVAGNTGTKETEKMSTSQSPGHMSGEEQEIDDSFPAHCQTEGEHTIDHFPMSYTGKQENDALQEEDQVAKEQSNGGHAAPHHKLPRSLRSTASPPSSSRHLVSIPDSASNDTPQVTLRSPPTVSMKEIERERSFTQEQEGPSRGNKPMMPGANLSDEVDPNFTRGGIGRQLHQTKQGRPQGLENASLDESNFDPASSRPTLTANGNQTLSSSTEDSLVEIPEPPRISSFDFPLGPVGDPSPGPNREFPTSIPKGAEREQEPTNTQTTFSQAPRQLTEPRDRTARIASLLMELGPDAGAAPPAVTPTATGSASHSHWADLGSEDGRDLSSFSSVSSGREAAHPPSPFPTSSLFWGRNEDEESERPGPSHSDFWSPVERADVPGAPSPTLVEQEGRQFAGLHSRCAQERETADADIQTGSEQDTGTSSGATRSIAIPRRPAVSKTDSTTPASFSLEAGSWENVSGSFFRRTSMEPFSAASILQPRAESELQPQSQPQGQIESGISHSSEPLKPRPQAHPRPLLQAPGHIQPAEPSSAGIESDEPDSSTLQVLSPASFDFGARRSSRTKAREVSSPSRNMRSVSPSHSYTSHEGGAGPSLSVNKRQL